MMLFFITSNDEWRPFNVRVNPWRWSVRASGGKNFLELFRVIRGFKSLLAIPPPTFSLTPNSSYML